MRGINNPPKGFGRGKGHMANIVEEFEGEDMQYQDYWGSSHDYPEGEYLEDGYHGEEFQETADDPQAEESEVNPRTKLCM